jgi:hypothetical protein
MQKFLNATIGCGCLLMLLAFFGGPFVLFLLYALGR